jgi:hypothetical protein
MEAVADADAEEIRTGIEFSQSRLVGADKQIILAPVSKPMQGHHTCLGPCKNGPGSSKGPGSPHVILMHERSHPIVRIPIF